MPDSIPFSVLVAAPLPPFLAAPLTSAYTCVDYYRSVDKAGLLREHGRSIRGLVMAGGTVLSEALLEALPSLEIISVFGVGYDGVPLKTCRERGIHVTNTPDVLTDDVADIAVALVLMTSRNLLNANRYLYEGKWLERQFDLAWRAGGKKAGIFGLGRIGKAIAKRLESHGMEIGYHGRSPQSGSPYQYQPSLTGLAAWADFLIVSCPGGESTKHAVDASVLAALGSKGTLINIARGSVVDEVALVQALQNGQIRGAGLDVYEHEPKVPAELLAQPNAVLLPHIGSGTHETRQAMADLVLQNLEAHFAGRPLVTPV